MARLTRFEKDYLASTAATREQRLHWFREARYGLFITWGPHAVVGRQEWSMAHEQPTLAEYEANADAWHPKRGAAREWARLARKGGMKYAVLVTKHHDGFLLWDSRMGDYNAAKRGPKRDLVREFVDACRAEGLRVGLYYSMMDWHHPDGHKCLTDGAARQRFLDYTHGCVRELCANYGNIDILWYDVSAPLSTARDWDSYRLNAMVRELQPGILINNRSKIDEDFMTPEGVDGKAIPDHFCEMCMPTNSSWGWQDAPADDWMPTRQILNILRSVTAQASNLLLNIGPKPDGSVPEIIAESITRVGRWLDRYGDIIYGKVERASTLAWHPVGQFTRKGRNTAYFWIFRWAGKQISISNVTSRLQSVRIYPNGKPLPFTQQDGRLIISGLPATCPDKGLNVTVLEMKFKEEPRRDFPFFYPPALRG